jgi:electron transfer flavoprotein alpha subunit
MEHTATARINPRRPYVIAASGLKRIILGAEEGSRELLRTAHGAHEKPLRSTRAATSTILVVLHSERGGLDEHARQSIAAAALLADADTGVVVAVLGGCAEELGALGADTAIELPDLGTAHYQVESALAQVQALVAQYQPRHILLPERDADADLGRRLAARSGATIATDVVELTRDAACRIVPGGRFARCELPRIILLARHAVDATLPFTGRGERASAPVAAQVAPHRVRDLGVESSDPGQIALEEADFIISGGNGMRDMAGFAALAQALGAASGASRVAVDDGRFERARQIGATGKTVQASVYLAIGISGAVQHLQGIKDCRHVIAVNLDESAPIVKRANLTLIEDSTALMQALLSLVSSHR